MTSKIGIFVNKRCAAVDKETHSLEELGLPCRQLIGHRRWRRWSSEIGCCVCVLVQML